MRKSSPLISGLAWAFVLMCTNVLWGQAKENQQDLPMSDSLPNHLLNTVLVVVKVPHSNAPMAATTLDSKKLAVLNNGQDMPYLLRFAPSMVVTSDAGNGVGYTGMWLRGSDPSRINVSINDIPLNDPESQQVFWVNTPDLGSSTSNVQIQRGVGTSSSGVGSFGGSVKVDTRQYGFLPYAQVSTGYGAYQTARTTLAFGTGWLKDNLNVNARLSQIGSQGYLDRAATKLYSAYVDAEWKRIRSQWRLVAFSGREKTYQSWYGTPWEVLYGTAEQKQAFIDRNGLDLAQAQNVMQSGRTFNYYQYPNQNDVYGQDHLQLNCRNVYNKRWVLSTTLNYTHGAGYFEEEKKNENYEKYGFSPQVVGDDTLFATDLVRRRWLKNHFFGGVFSLFTHIGRSDLTLGGNAHQYLGEHFGELIWLQNAGSIEKNQRYYQGWSDKRDANIYLKLNKELGSKWDMYFDAQVRGVDYSTQGIDNDLKSYKVDSKFVFFNPKAGVTYMQHEDLKWFVSVARGNKEPNRNDFVDALDVHKVKHESMLDYEIGGAFNRNGLVCNINAYYMDYQNQLVLNGTLNDVGAPLRTNVKDSYRTGIEWSSEYTKKCRANQSIGVMANCTVSRNRIAHFDNVVYDYGGEQVVTLTEKMKDVPISFSPAVISGVQLRYEIFTKVADELLTFVPTAEQLKERKRSPFAVMLMWKYVGKQYMDNTGNEALAIQPYQVVDARLSYEYLSKQRTYTIEFSLGVNNLLGSEYVSNGYTYSYIWGTRVTERYYYPQALRQWNLGLTFKI